MKKQQIDQHTHLRHSKREKLAQPLHFSHKCVFRSRRSSFPPPPQNATFNLSLSLYLFCRKIYSELPPPRQIPLPQPTLHHVIRLRQILLLPSLRRAYPLPTGDYPVSITSLVYSTYSIGQSSNSAPEAKLGQLQLEHLGRC